MRWFKHGSPNFTLRSHPSLSVPADPIDLAYLAGLIDGEGCIGNHSPGYSTLKIAMCDREVIDWIAKTLGGKVYVYIKSNSKHRTVYEWSTSQQHFIKQLSSALIPYMKLESKKALMKQLIDC